MEQYLKMTIEWNGVVYRRDNVITNIESTVNPGDKTLPLLGQTAETMLNEILQEIVSASVLSR